MLNESFRTILCWYLSCRSSIWCPCRYQHQYMPTDQIINDMVSVWLCRSLFLFLRHHCIDEHFVTMSLTITLVNIDIVRTGWVDCQVYYTTSRVVTEWRRSQHGSVERSDHQRNGECLVVCYSVVCYSRRFLLSHDHCDGHVDIFRTGWMDWPGYYTS